MPSSFTAEPIALDMQAISKTFGDRCVLDIERLTIHPGEIHALLGQNGSGKSTLIKILAGYHAADPSLNSRTQVMGNVLGEESARSRRDAGLRFVHQDLGLVATMSVLDNVYMGRPYPTRFQTIHSREARASAQVALARAGVPGIDPDIRVDKLAPSERTGVAIARALASDEGEHPAVLVLDEPTATLPAPEAARLLETLVGVAETGVAILYVTHNLDEVFTIADRVSVLRDGRMVASEAVAQASRQEIIHHLIGAELEAVHREEHTTLSSPSAAPLLVAENLVGDWLNDVSFSVGLGEVVGFHGVTGSGRDSVLGTVFGRLQRRSGVVRIGLNELAPGRPEDAITAGVAYVPPERKTSGAIMALTAKENTSIPSLRELWRRGRFDTARETRESSTWFKRLDIRPADGANLPLTSFSGGNQQKVVLAKWLKREPRILLMDEPTQGVDIGAKATIHRSILDAVGTGLAVVLASSDVEELAALCSVVHVMHRGEIVASVLGADINVRELNRQLNAVADRATHSGGPTHG